MFSQCQNPDRPYPFASQPPISDYAQLDFTDLTVFELVHDQYQHWGIRFEGAIAMQPSNPCFGVESETLVLMPIASHPSIRVYFRQCKQMLGAAVTGARQIKLRLFDKNDRILAEQSAGNNHYLPSSAESLEPFPHHLLEVLAENVAKAEFSSDAPFILHHFFWS